MPTRSSCREGQGKWFHGKVQGGAGVDGRQRVHFDDGDVDLVEFSTTRHEVIARGLVGGSLTPPPLSRVHVEAAGANPVDACIDVKNNVVNSSGDADTNKNGGKGAPPTPTTACRVGVFLKERDAERDQVFNAVLARAGYIMAVGVVLLAIATILDTSALVSNTVYWYTASFGYLIPGCAIMLLSTLPPDKFDRTCIVEQWCVRVQCVCMLCV
jgi:hypothetical protein